MNYKIKILEIGVLFFFVISFGLFMQLGSEKTMMPIITDRDITINTLECRNPYDGIGLEPKCQEYCNSIGGQVYNQWAVTPYWTTCFIVQPQVVYTAPMVDKVNR